MLRSVENPIVRIEGIEGPHRGRGSRRNAALTAFVNTVHALGLDRPVSCTRVRPGRICYFISRPQLRSLYEHIVLTL